MSPTPVSPPETEPGIATADFDQLTSSGIAASTAVAPIDAVPELSDSSGPTPGSIASKTLPERFSRGINWWVTGWMAVMHVGAVVALWHFSWSALVVFFVTHFMSACLGITLGYHRLLTHGSFVAPAWFRYAVSLCGMMSAEGSPLMWVATHRKHHVSSDEEDDPHSPLHGFWWSHMLWFMPYDTKAERTAFYERWAPDLFKDPVHRALDSYFILVPLTVGAAMYAAGEYFFGAGLSWLMWGLCMRMVVAYHCTWFVNSATHIWGYRNYTTTDQSRNLWWVALLSYGEGWHNNHHAHQRMAVHGHRWWEFDVTYNVIRLLKVLGIATKVQDRMPKEHA